MAKQIILLSFLCLCMAGSLFASPVYIGSFEVDQGPYWSPPPPAYSGQEAAALIFGGAPSSYSISIDPSVITNTAWYSTWGGACGGSFPCGTVYPENYSYNTGGFYLNPGDVSAYVLDWAQGPQYTNYVWQSVPEPGLLSLLAIGIAGLVAGRKRFIRK